MVCLSRLSAFFLSTFGGRTISDKSDIDTFPLVDITLEEYLGSCREEELRFRLGAMGGRRLLDIAELRRVQEVFREVFIL